MSTEGPTAREYWCFISYRHADNKEPGRQWATWLHQAIETYEVPRDLDSTVNARRARLTLGGQKPHSPACTDASFSWWWVRRCW
jgi:hypothetical protein